MTTIVAAVAALGLLLVYDGITGPRGRRKKAVTAGFDRLAREAGVAALGGHRGPAAMTGFFIVTFLLVAGVSSSLVIALVFAALAASAPLGYLRARRARRRRRLREAWPDALAGLISGVRAGIALPAACASLETRGPGDLRPGFGTFASTYRLTGSFQGALDRMRDVLADPVADRVIVALQTAHEVGGTDLVRVLRTLSDFVREDLRVRKEIEARWSWTVTAARVAAGAPWVVLLMMSSRPEAALAYNSPAGAVTIVGGAIATIVGYRLMLRAGRLPEQRRLGG